MRKHLATIIVAAFLLALVGHIALQGTLGDRHRAAKAAAVIAHQHNRQMIRRGVVMERNEPYRRERQALHLSPPEYRKLLAERGQATPDDAELHSAAGKH